MAANFFFLNIEKASNVFDHLLVGKSHLRTSWAIRRGRHDDVGGVASAVNGRRQARWDKNGGRRMRHCWAIKEVVEGIE